MFDELDFFLSQRTNEYRAGFLIEAVQKCFDARGTSILDAVTDLVHGMVETPTDDALDRITHFVLDNLDASLKEFSVVIVDSALVGEQIPLLTEILDTLLIADRYEDPEALIAIVDSAESTEDALAEIVEEISGPVAELVLDVVESVQPELLERVVIENTKRMASFESMQPMDTSIDKRRAVVERVKHSEHYDREGPVESKLAISGLFNQEPLTIVQSLGDTLDEVRGELLAKACYQIAMCSNVASNAVVGTAKIVAESLLREADPVELQKVAFLLNRFPAPSVEV